MTTTISKSVKPTSTQAGVISEAEAIVHSGVDGANRLYRGDCKQALDKLISEGIRVDLIYLDPPFNSSKTYSMLFNGRSVTGQQKAYHDMWDFTPTTQLLMTEFLKELDGWELPDGFRQFMRLWLDVLNQGTAADKKLLNYLMYMTQRLVRLNKILKDTGSIYLHCDPTASHYLKVIMDGVFGRDNFQNELVWCYTGPGRVTSHFPRKHDVILFYSKDTKKHKFYPDQIRVPYTRMSGTGRTSLASANRSKEELREIEAVYSARGKLIEDYWTDIGSGSHIPKSERLGYPTQKPLKLLNRILSASSKEGDLVLDPFCGCGTTVEAAQSLKRRWIGVDISGDAVKQIKRRLERVGSFETADYKLIELNPDTMTEYRGLNPYEKQDWVIRKLGGLPNPKKSGDGGVDGEMTIHMGGFKAKTDVWGKVVFSVKTGSQKSPSLVRELLGTMRQQKADAGVLVLDVDPSTETETRAAKAGTFDYQQSPSVPPEHYNLIQIVTASQAIDGVRLRLPPSRQAIELYRDAQLRLKG